MAGAGARADGAVPNCRAGAAQGAALAQASAQLAAALGALREGAEALRRERLARYQAEAHLKLALDDAAASKQAWR